MAKLIKNFLTIICITMLVFCMLSITSYSNAKPSQLNRTELILNSTYEIEGKIFTMKNGSCSDFDEKTGEGMRVTLQKNDIIFDDLTGGGHEGAIVKLAYNTGGMGTFYVIAILRYDKGTYRQVFHIYAGTNYDYITFGLTKQSERDRTISIKVKNRSGKEYTIHCALSKLLF